MNKVKEIYLECKILKFKLNKLFQNIFYSAISIYYCLKPNAPKISIKELSSFTAKLTSSKYIKKLSLVIKSSFLSLFQQLTNSYFISSAIF